MGPFGISTRNGIDPRELTSAIEDKKNLPGGEDEPQIPVEVWRSGSVIRLAVAPGPLGVTPSSRAPTQAMRASLGVDLALDVVRGPALTPLPGSRTEVLAIADVFRRRTAKRPTKILLGSDANERILDSMAHSGELGDFAVLHFATHGDMDTRRAMRSALMLSRSATADTEGDVLAEPGVYDGRLTVEQIVRDWKLNADLVTLSACQTALGREAGGEGFIGFAQALFMAGARSLLLSLWKVDDTATTLLMIRFYENVLGAFDESRTIGGRSYASGKPMPKAEALREAKQWLRSCTPAQNRKALERTRTRGFLGGQKAGEDASTELDFSDPYYWAAFVLIGDAS